MQVPDPPWKIRTRPCPFYSQGKCLFSKNCSFLHQVKSTPTVIRVTAPEEDYSDGPDSSTTVPAKLPSSTPPETLPAGLRSAASAPVDSYFDPPGSDSEPDEDDTSDLDSPTIRKPLSSSTVQGREGLTIVTGAFRDSVATVKGGSQGSEPPSRASTSYSMSHFYAQDHRGSSRYSTLSLSTPPRNDSGEVGGLLLSPFPESSADASLSQSNSPSSATSANGQVVEVPVLGGPLRIIPQFTLATAGSSSLLTNRLAKARGHDSSSPPTTLLTPNVDPSPTTPFSAGELYASYQQDEAEVAPLSPVPDAFADAASPDQVVSPTPHAIPKTPSWLRPLRLATALTPQSGSRSPLSSTLNLRQSTDVSELQSLSTSTSSSVSPARMYDSLGAHNSSSELHSRSSTASSPFQIPTDTPHTIVLSDHDGYMSPLALSRNASLDIDMSHYPPPPASSSSNSAHDPSSSPASISFSELIGRSPRARPATITIPTITSFEDTNVGSDAPRSVDTATTPAEQLRSALERRAKRLRESSQLLASTDLQNFHLDPNFSSDSQNLLADSTVATSISHSRSMSSMPDFSRSESWNPSHRNDILSLSVNLPSTSASDSLLLQAQSSPPRASPDLRASPSAPSTSPLTQLALSPDPSPRPRLLFAIASDQPGEVERLLSTGEASANETTGTGAGLLEFTVTNDGLKNKTEIVKTLLKYGADPGPLNDNAIREDAGAIGDLRQSPVLAKKVEEGMNPALKYYLNRQSLDVDSKPALEALQQSSFAPLAKARFDIIGQDRALDEFYRVLGMHSQRKGRNALVILLCGASGHGKSLLAQKVGSLLDVPTHTINMTALRSQHDLWQCLSTGIDDASPDLDLAEFLVENQGKRCVVVLDEIEKVDDSKSLNPLLLPWDIGRCSLEQKKHTDTSKVIWIATSNLGQRLISEHVEGWGHTDTPPSRAEYTQLATAVRRRIAEVLGASLLSRVTAILPFLPFTEVEKIAIGTEAALSQREFASTARSSAEIEAVVRRAVKDINFVEEEGARSLYRVVETHLSRS